MLAPFVGITRDMGQWGPRYTVGAALDVVLRGTSVADVAVHFLVEGGPTASPNHSDLRQISGQPGDRQRRPRLDVCRGGAQQRHRRWPTIQKSQLDRVQQR